MLSFRAERTGSPASTGVPSELVRWGGSLLAGQEESPHLSFDAPQTPGCPIHLELSATGLRCAAAPRAEGPPYTSLGRRPRLGPPQESRGLKARHKVPPEILSSPSSCAKAAMSHHPHEIKFPPKWQMSYPPFATINVVELIREGPASTPGLSPLREPCR